VVGTRNTDLIIHFKKRRVGVKRLSLNSGDRYFSFALAIFKLFYKYLRMKFYQRVLLPLNFYKRTVLNESLISPQFNYRYLTRFTNSITIIRRYVYRHLKFHYTINRIFFPFIKGLREFIKPSGFLAKCCGRFTRRQRATLRCYQLGNIPKNTISSPIEYTVISVPLKYGVGTVKLWLHVRRLWTSRRGFPIRFRSKRFYKHRRVFRRFRHFLYKY